MYKAHALTVIKYFQYSLIQVHIRLLKVKSILDS